MTVFKDSADLKHCIGALYDKAKCDSRIAPRIRNERVVIQFRYNNPIGIVTINASAPPTQPRAFFDVLWGDDTGLSPDIIMSMQADIAHQFWHGKINLLAALARRQIVIDRGPLPKVLKMLPMVAPLYRMYPQVLRELGRMDIILQ